jgi:hypothetical protein
VSFVKSTSKRVCLGAVALLCSGCFTYVPAEPSTVAPGEDLRVHLAREALAADLAGISNAPSPIVDGRLMRRDADQLVLRVPAAVQSTGILTRTLGQDVAIPESRVVLFERRELNRARTVLASAGGAAILAAVLVSFGVGVPNPELPPKTEPEELRRGYTIPLFSIGVR